MKNVVYVLKIMLPLVLISAVTVGLLAAVNAFTAPVIEKNEAEALQKNMTELFEDGIDAPAVLEYTDKNVRSVYEIKKNGSVIGYCFDVTGSGAYNGKIEVLVAVNTDGTVRGIRNVKNSETSSVGVSKVLNNGDYVSLYNGKTIDTYASVETRMKDDAAGINTTGATKSATALKNAVRNALAAFAEINGKEAG